MLILTPADFSVSSPTPASALFDWAASGNGQQINETGQCAASLLPRDEDVVLVLPPLIWGWLTYRVMAHDTLADFATPEEQASLLQRFGS